MRIYFPNTYPKHLPVVREIESVIPTNYHSNPDGSLCLGAPAELYLIFSESPNLNTFMRIILNPYLYRWLYFSKTGKDAWSDRSHGVLGIMDSYSSLLGVKTLNAMIDLLTSIVKNDIHSAMLCPCGSGEIVERCHMEKIIEISSKIPHDVIIKDLVSLKDARSSLR